MNDMFGIDGHGFALTGLAIDLADILRTLPSAVSSRPVGPTNPRRSAITPQNY
jgi:hypothetical protein